MNQHVAARREVDEDGWRIPEFKWNEGMTFWQSAKAFRETPTGIVQFNSLGGLIVMVALVIGGASVANFLGLSLLIVFGIPAFLFVALIYSSFVSKHQTYRNWHSVPAVVVDYELKPTERRRSTSSSGGGSSYYYDTPFRVHCQYRDQHGQVIDCSPQNAAMANFPSDKAVFGYLEKHASGGQCQLLIHPKYPRLAMIGLKPKEFPAWPNWLIGGVVAFGLTILTVTIVKGGYVPFWKGKNLLIEHG